MLRVIVRSQGSAPVDNAVMQHSVKTFDIRTREDIEELENYIENNQPSYGAIWIDGVELVKEEEEEENA